MKNIFDLTNKVILFTGGYGYLAAPCVKYFSHLGAKVYVLARDESKFEKEFKSSKGIFFIQCDISSTDDIKASVKFIYEKEDRIDAIINNAFYTQGQSPERMSDVDFNIGIEGTLNSVFKFIREILPIYKSQKFGKIINVSSMYGVVAPDFKLYEDSPAFLNPPHYGAAKAGVIQLTKYYASYLGKDNIQVNCVTPGPFPSEKTRNTDPEFEKRLAEMTLLNRVGMPEDLIGVFVLLASSASDFITGQNFIIDGGWTSK